MNKPLLVVDVERESSPHAIREWIERSGITVLNVAGPRESSQPGIHAEARELLKRTFDG